MSDTRRRVCLVMQSPEKNPCMQEIPASARICICDPNLAVKSLRSQGLSFVGGSQVVRNARKMGSEGDRWGAHRNGD